MNNLIDTLFAATVHDMNNLNKRIGLWVAFKEVPQVYPAEAS
jgi:hypothetical protein